MQAEGVTSEAVNSILQMMFEPVIEAAVSTKQEEKEADFLV